MSTQVPVEVLPAAEPSKRKRARRASMAERIEKALTSPNNGRRFTEGVIKTTGQRFFDFPWESPAARPWREGYTRVLIPLAQPTSKGKRCIVQVIHNSKLSHG